MADVTPTAYPATYTYAANSSVQLTAKPGVGYRFVGWSGGATDTSPTISVPIDCPKAITATFAAITYHLTTAVRPADEGNISLEPPQPAAGYLAGTHVTLRAKPARDKDFSSWEGAASGILPAAVVIMNADKSVTAVFVDRETNVVGWIVGVIAFVILGLIIYVYVIRKPAKPGKRQVRRQ